MPKHLMRGRFDVHCDYRVDGVDQKNIVAGQYSATGLSRVSPVEVSTQSNLGVVTGKHRR